MKILFLFHHYVNNGMTDALCAVSEPVFCSTAAMPARQKNARRMSWSEFFSLRRRLRAGEFDLVITYGCEETLWPTNRPFFRRVFHAIKKLLVNFPALAPRLLLPTIKASRARLIIYDYDDLTIIPPLRWPFLEACHLYFKVHPAINLHKSFLFQTRRDGNLWNILRNPRYNLWIKKIQPISYGTAYQDYYDECLATEKKYDVFFAGGLHYSQVRREGRAILEELQAKGLNVCLPAKVPHREFLKLCSESWLVLSPEGAEWQSARHYESLLMKSVPLMNYPTVRLQNPLIDGVHAWYYPPEDKLLADVIHRALADKPRLQKMAEEGREYVLRHHVHAQIVKHMLDLAQTDAA